MYIHTAHVNDFVSQKWNLWEKNQDTTVTSVM